MHRPRPIAFLLPLLLSGCLAELDRPYPDWRNLPEPPPPVLSAQAVLADPVPVRLPATPVARWLIMIPGVETGPVDAALRWLDHLRRAGSYDCALLLDWQADNAFRRLLSPTATSAGGQELMQLIQQLRQHSPAASIDLIAHSGGTVVLAKAAMLESGLDLRHVLLLGTPHSYPDVLDPLLRQAAVVRNIWSQYDAINRRLAAGDGQLPGLVDVAPHGNIEMSLTATGRLVRHETVLEDDPLLIRQWALYLRHGDMPQPKAWRETPVHITSESDMTRLHRAILAFAAGENDQPVLLRALPRLLRHQNPEVQAYAVMAVGLYGDIRYLPDLRRLLQQADTPVWLRRAIYRAFANLRLPDLVEDLRWAREHDPANAVITRDVLRELKRARIEPQR